MNEIIRSKQNTTIKQIAKLLTKKERDKTKLFLVEGSHMIEEAYKARCLTKVFLLEDTSIPFDVETVYCSQEVLNKLSSQTSNAKMIGLCNFPQIHTTSKRVLLLDNIQDPGNLGTLIRTAYSFGFNQIIYSPHCADAYNAKTLQSSQGAIFHISLERTDLVGRIQEFQNQGYTIYGTALHANSIQLQDLQVQNAYGLVLGNEGQGISQEILKICDQSLIIEMEAFESLNVGVAGGIAMYSLKQKEK